MAAGAPFPFTIEPLGSTHDRAAFSCGEQALDDYIRQQASQDVKRGVSRVFVAVEAAATTGSPASTTLGIAGYYTLSSTSFGRADLSPALAKKLPHYPVPAAILGRLAVDQKHRGQKLGTFLLFDAFDKVVQVNRSIAIYALIVDAKNGNAAAWYQKYGFQPFFTTPLRLFVPVTTLAKARSAP
jgi:GNAT superfamily N-acetyltransferase